MKNMMKMLLVFVAMVSVSWGESISLGETVQDDWAQNSDYNFTLSEKTRVSIISSQHTNIWLFNNQDKVIGVGDTLSSGNSRLIIELEVGTYHIDIAVDGDYNGSDTHYTLALEEATMKPIVLNSSVAGTWTENSELSPRTYRPSENYTFTLIEETEVSILLTSLLENKHAYLLDSNGVIRGETYGHLPMISHLNAGTYSIDVTTYDGNSAIGDFTLNLKKNIIHTTPIIFENRVSGAWTKDSGALLGSERYTENYTFTLTEEKFIHIHLFTELDGWLNIVNSNGTRVDDLNERTNDMGIDLEAGGYTIRVVLGNKPQFGKFNIEINADVAIPNEVTEIVHNNIDPFTSTLRWNHSDTNVVGYKIYFDNKLVTIVDVKVGNYTFYGLESNHTYSYSIEAYNSAGVSAKNKGTFTTLKDNYAWLIPVYGLLLQ